MTSINETFVSKEGLEKLGFASENKKVYENDLLEMGKFAVKIIKTGIFNEYIIFYENDILFKKEIGEKKLTYMELVGVILGKLNERGQSD